MPTPSRELASLRASFQRPERIPYPSTNPYSAAKYDLGKKLFFDPRLSGSGTMSCATCHDPQRSWTDGRALGVGHDHKVLSRRVPTILNLAWGWSFFWDGRAETLEDQALGPIQNPDEMNQPIPALVDKLRAVAGYREAFEKAFPGEGISGKTIGKAIATFERSIVSDLAPFDHWVAGEEDAISDGAKRGFLVFNTKGACVKCHTGWSFTNGQFADIGLPTEDIGRGKLQPGNRFMRFTFKTPTLRNVTKRGPYMHDGSIASLAEIIERYDRGGLVKRETSQLFLKPMGLTAQEKKDLLSFLETLESRDEAVTPPELPANDR